MKESFNELYTRLYNENITELEALREKNKKQMTIIIFSIIACIIGTILFPYFMPIIIIGAIVAIVISITKGNISKVTKKTNQYQQVFKQKIVTPLIENVFEGGTYEPEKGWARIEYKKGEYRDDIDRYSSEDMITAPIMVDGKVQTVIQFAEVHTERESRDKDGHTTYSTQFYGLAGRMGLNRNIGAKIYIRNNGIFSSLNKNKVTMDMGEFEKIFDVEATDKILAVRILTADVMTEIMELYRKFKYRFEIHIINDTIYMRISTGEVFEPNIFKNSMEYKTVEKYYLILQAVMNINKHIYDIVNEIEI